MGLDYKGFGFNILKLYTFCIFHNRLENKYVHIERSLITTSKNLKYLTWDNSRYLEKMKQNGSVKCKYLYYLVSNKSRVFTFLIHLFLDFSTVHVMFGFSNLFMSQEDAQALCSTHRFLALIT